MSRAEADFCSISDWTVQVYVPWSPSLTLEMVRESSSFLILPDKHAEDELLSVCCNSASTAVDEEDLQR